MATGTSADSLASPAFQNALRRKARKLETAKIFASPHLKRNSPDAILLGFAADPYGFGHNDLQPVAESLCPDVKRAIKWLEGLSPQISIYIQKLAVIQGTVKVPWLEMIAQFLDFFEVNFS